MLPMMWLQLGSQTTFPTRRYATAFHWSITQHLGMDLLPLAWNAVVVPGWFLPLPGKKTATLRFTPASMEIASGNLRFHDVASGDAEVARVFSGAQTPRMKWNTCAFFRQTSEIKTIQRQCYGKTGCIITSKDTGLGSPATLAVPQHVDSHRDHRVYCKKTIQYNILSLKEKDSIQI